MTEPGKLLATTQLLARYRDGEQAAADDLFRRYMPKLRRWARGRLPAYGRDLSETEDLVQVTFYRALNRLKDFDTQQPGGFLAYLRTILLNLVREEIRNSGRRPAKAPLEMSLPSNQAAPLEQVIGSEQLAVYERALSKLPDMKRNAVIMRLEFGMSFEEIATELERPSANAARMTVSRAVDELATLMAP